MRKLIFANRKGGSGKTTVAINLAVALARKKKHVLFIDLDSQAHATFFFSIKLDQHPLTLLNFLNREIEEAALLQKSRYEKITVIPADQKISQINEIIGENYFFLKEIINKWEKQFDFLLIDVPPSLEKLVVCGLAAADETYVPLQMHFLPLKGVAQLLQLVLNLNKEINPRLRVAGFIPTLFNERTRIYKTVLEELKENFPESMLLPGIPYDIKLAEAPSFRKSIFEYAPKSKAAEAFSILAGKIAGRAGENE